MSNSLKILDQKEEEISDLIRKFSSSDLLFTVSQAVRDHEKPGTPSFELFHKAPAGIPLFAAAGVSNMAIRWSNPFRGKTPTWLEFGRLIKIVTDYLINDPITFDDSIEQTFFHSHPVLLLLRMAGSQFPYNTSFWGQFARPHLIFKEIPESVTFPAGCNNFNFKSEFAKLFRVSLEDFMKVGFVAWAASCGSGFAFRRDYFEKARQQCAQIPDDEVLIVVLDKLSADPIRFRETYELRKQSDRRFRIYDFNPLLAYPILRPWARSDRLSMKNDRMIAPLPNLIPYRLCEGIYFEMLDSYKMQFTEWFGHVFNAYVGRILKESMPISSIWSEEGIRRTYFQERGKVPDWVIVDGSSAILIECKATRFSRPALETAADQAVKDSLKQVRKGIKQLCEFSNSIISRANGLEAFHSCSNFYPIVVTLEPFYVLNPSGGRDYLNSILANEDGVSNLDWQLLSLQELEYLQPYINGGFGFANALNLIIQQDYNFENAINHIVASTGLTYRDSFMIEIDNQLHESLGVMGLALAEG